MRQFFLNLAFSAIAIIALHGVTLTTPADAAGRQNFTIVNDTGYDIKALYVSPHNAKTWEEDVLGKDTLDDGDSWNIKFSKASTACIWDLKVVYADDNSSAVWSDIDLCSISKITIRYNRKTDTTSAVFD